MIIDHPPEESLVAFALGEAPAEGRPDVATHLGACAACCSVVDELERALATYRDAHPAPAPREVLADLLAAQTAANRAATSPGERSGARPRPARVALALAAVALLFLSGFWTGRLSAGPEIGGAPTAPASDTIPAATTIADSLQILPDPPMIRFTTTPALKT